MPGFTHEASEDINHLKNLLEDQYPASAVIKELLQNADDAGATCFHVGYHPGIRDSHHPLLCCPAVLAANDGELRSEHVDKIHRIGTGSKADDARAIGKFGLGMKSIFHLCEAFFYLASPTQPASEGHCFLTGMLNPWCGIFHESWETLFETEAQEHLIAIVTEWLKDMPHWFCLWIPLRNAQALEGIQPLVQRYPRYVDIRPIDAEFQMASMMPLLRSVREVAFYQQPDANWQLDFDVRFSDHAEQCIGPERPDRLPPGSSKPLHTQLICQPGGWNSTIIGTEELLSGPRYLEFRERPEWPTRMVTTQTGIGLKEEEHAPHTGAFWMHTPSPQGQVGKLHIVPAVFLPLQEPFDEVSLPLPYDIQLLLHGCFFLDSGRKHIKQQHEGYERDRNIDDNPVLSEWNTALLLDGVLPHVLPNLDRFVDELHLTLDEVKTLTHGILHTAFYRLNRSAMCATNKWIAQLTENGLHWQLQNVSVPVLGLPDPQGLHTLPFEIFPALKQLCTHETITFDDWPALGAEYSQVSWGTKLTQLVSGLEPISLADPIRLAYLTRLLQQEGSALCDDALTVVIQAVQQVIAMRDRHTQPYLDVLEKFVLTLPRSRWVSLQGNISDEFWRGVGSLDLQTLLLPKKMMGTETGEARPLPVEDAKCIFAWLESNEAIPSKWVVANEIINACRDAAVTLRQQLGHYRLFDITDQRTNDKTTVSWNHIITLSQKRQLYSITQRERVGIEALLEALPTHPFYHLIEDAPRQLSKNLSGDTVTIPACDVSAARHLLASRPTLAPPDKREALLRFLTNSAPEQDERQTHYRAMRYLLHGQSTYYEDDTTTLLAVDASGRSVKIWEKIEDKLLDHASAQWRLVPSNLARIPGNWDAINLASISRATVVSELKQGGMRFINGADFTEAERVVLLRDLADDTPLWRLLPFHQTLTGDIVSIDGMTYLDTGISVPQGIASKVTLIRIPSDQELATQYQKLIAPWDISALIRIALNQESPEQFCDDILSALSSIDAAGFDAEALSLLSETPWLHSRNHPFAIKPCDIVYLPGMEDAIARLFTEENLEGSFFDEGVLTEGILHSPGIGFLREHCFAQGQDAIFLIGGDIGQLPSYRIGQIDAFINQPTESEEANLALLLHTAGVELPWHQGLALLKATFECISPAAACELLHHLICHPPIDDLCKAIAAMQEATIRTQAHTPAHNQCQTVHTWLIGAFVNHPDFTPSHLTQLQLRNQIGQWVSASRVCIDVDGIDPTSIIAHDLASILRERIQLPEDEVPLNSAGTNDGPPDDEASAEALKAYFLRWDGRVSDGLIGAFLAYLGDAAVIRSMAEDYLRPHSIQFVRDACPWVMPQVADMVTEPTIHEAMSRQRFSIRIIPALHAVTVRNVCGTYFTASQSEQFDQLFIGSSSFSRITAFHDRRYLLTLRDIDPSRYTKKELGEFLLTTTHDLLNRVYLQRNASLEQLWQQLSESGQLDIAVTQHLVVKHAPFYFQQLRSLSDDHLKRISKQIRDLEYRVQEYLQNGMTALPDHTLQEAGAEQLKLLAKLQQLLAHDDQTQASLLEAVRGKVRDYQYNEDSIPFELFQNADDAVVELCQMRHEDQAKNQNKRIVVIILGNALYWLHWGRPINQFRMPGFSAEQGRDLGYHRDLEKMLFLSTSDKSDHMAKLTGKFGLGFKSTFLIAQRPRILSGELGFAVVGGLYPQHLSTDERLELKHITASYAEPHLCTVIALTDTPDKTLGPLMSRFHRLLPILLAFSSAIRQCEYKENGETENISWTAEPISGISMSTIGYASIPRLFNRALLLTDAQSRGLLLLKVAARGVEKFSSEVPSIWNTAPTDETVAAGFAVNGDFALDVGRGRLAALEHQQAEIQHIGYSIATSLVELFNASLTQWETFRSELGIARDVSPYQFWASVWETLSITQWLQAEEHRQNRAVQLIQEILWGQGNGIAALIETHQALPTGLPDEYEILTAHSAVEYETVGILDDPQVFQVVSCWPDIRTKLPPGSVISSKRVGMRLDCMLKRTSPRKALGIQEIVKIIVGNRRVVTPEWATRFGCWLKDWDHIGELEKNDVTGLALFLQTLQFQTADNSYQGAKDLLSAQMTGADGREECLRSAFAPPERLLDPAYTNEALHFFKLCRGVMNADATTLAGWGRRASSDEARKAFLKYLYEGQLSYPIRDNIQSIQSSGWMSDQDTVTPLLPGERNADTAILGYLGLLPADPANIASMPVPNLFENWLKPVEQVPDHAKVVNDIARWWEHERNAHIAEFETLHYPEPQVMLGALATPYERTQEQRQYWMMLFLRGALETMGNRRPEQHLGFLRLCYENDWLAALGEGEPSAEQLSALLNEYFNRPAEYLSYFQWLKEYFPFYFLSQWADDYITAIWTIGNSSSTEIGECRPDALFNTRSNPVFQGGGPDAPPLSGILGIGRLFVIREVKRLKIASAQWLDPYCYVPVQRVRRVMARLGCQYLESLQSRDEQSHAIYAYLSNILGTDRCTFQGDYDLPLQIIANNPQLWQSFLQEEKPDWVEDEIVHEVSA